MYQVDVSNMFYISIMKENITMALRIYLLKKSTVIIRIHLDTKDPGMLQNYQNMFMSYKGNEKNP